MDNLTHSLVGFTLARTPLGRAGRGATAALILASNAPDIDVVTLAGGPVTYLKWHRGPTHGLLGIVVLGVVTAAIVWLGRRLYDQQTAARNHSTVPEHDDNASFRMLAAVSVIGALAHVLMDVPTSYGTRLLSPIDWHWFAADLMPIIDVYLLAALVAGIVFGQRSPAARRRNASIVLTLMAANYGARIVTHQMALSMVPRLFGPTLPQPCEGVAETEWPIDVWPRSNTPVQPTARRCLVEAAAMPTFTSPFRWRIILKTSNAYELREIDLLDARWRSATEDPGAPWRTSIRYPDVWTPTVAQAAGTPLGQVFLGFSRFPAARSATDPRGDTTVRWTDVRFAGGLSSLDEPRPGPDIFTAIIRISATGSVLQERLGR